jgi:hypothetical protein
MPSLVHFENKTKPMKTYSQNKTKCKTDLVTTTTSAHKPLKFKIRSNKCSKIGLREVVE